MFLMHKEVVKFHHVLYLKEAVDVGRRGELVSFARGQQEL
jgi:hypothetical protein